MRFPIPFCYEATVLTSSHKEAFRRYRESVEVEVPEFGAGGLPVVLSWAGHHAGGGLPVDALGHGGRLYEVVTRRAWDAGEGAWLHVPVRAAEAAEAVAAAMAKRAPETEGLPGMRDVFVQEGVRKAFREDDPFSHKGPPKPSTVLRAYYMDDARETARAAAGDFVVVGGVLHRRVPEPVLVAGDGFVALAGDLGDSDRSRVFRLDDVALARERAEIIGSRGRGTVLAPAFELRRPDLLARDVEGMALLAAVRSLLKTVQVRMAGLPIPVMEAWCDLNEAYNPPRPDWSRPQREPDPSELVSAGRALVEAARPHLGDPVACREAEHALERAAERLCPARAPALA